MIRYATLFKKYCLTLTSFIAQVCLFFAVYYLMASKAQKMAKAPAVDFNLLHGDKSEEVQNLPLLDVNPPPLDWSNVVQNLKQHNSTNFITGSKVSHKVLPYCNSTI